jgi:hypothetical protein
MFWLLPELGAAYDAAGQPDSAAELLEQRGDRARAADYYSQFAELWRGADPDLQPRVAEARRRLAALTAEPGRQ